MTSIAVVEEDHCSHGIWNSGKPYRKIESIKSHFINNQRDSCSSFIKPQKSDSRHAFRAAQNMRTYSLCEGASTRVYGIIVDACSWVGAAGGRGGRGLCGPGGFAYCSFFLGAEPGDDG